jgi:hypothetical protein
MTGGQEEDQLEEPTMMNSRLGWTRTLTTLALVGGVVVSSLLTGGAVDAKHKKHHKAKTQTPPPVTTPAPPAITSDVSIVSIKTGPDSSPTSRSVLVEVKNDGDVALSPFVIELSADRDGASRLPQASAQITLGPNQSQTINYTAIGCKWLNIANHATLTATTNPNPVAGEDGPSNNNTLTIAPNLDFSGQAGCS